MPERVVGAVSPICQVVFPVSRIIIAGRPNNGGLVTATASPSHPNLILSYLSMEIHMVTSSVDLCRPRKGCWSCFSICQVVFPVSRIIIVGRPNNGDLVTATASPSHLNLILTYLSMETQMVSAVWLLIVAIQLNILPLFSAAAWYTSTGQLL